MSKYASKKLRLIMTYAASERSIISRLDISSWLRCIFTMCLLVILSACAGPRNLVGIETEVPVESVAGTSKHTVFIATSRASSEDPAEFFSGKRVSGLNFASVEVSVPPTHRKGEIETPSRAPADPRRHFVLNHPRNFHDRRNFQQQLSEYLMTLPPERRKILVFVHGYNTNMTSAILQASQFVEDSGYSGVPLLFSWASNAKTLEYVYDINSALVARDHLVSMFETVNLPAVLEYDVVAHSMGTFLVMEASRQIVLTTGLNPTRKLKNVVLAAPDIDVDLFGEQIKLFPKDQRNIIVLVSKDDKALRASRRVAGGVTRLGQASATDISRLGVTAIDLSDVEDEKTLSHSKFKDSPEVVQQIGEALKNGNSFNGAPSLSIGQAIAVGVDGTINALTPASH
ncbi:MAG: alpha/beta hydrolase [Tateyamaria sp.]|uniref:alpha/beta hydrolase n=1 Tax=Tateyamaria sp. TaxID=1929288 RepID=UPI00329E371F